MLTLADILAPALDDNIWLIIAVRFALVASVFIGGVSLIAMFSIWWERKVSGHIQSRLGPMHTGGWHGWSQSLADGIKLIQKEDLIPKGADQFMFRLAPYMAFVPVFAAFLVLPFGPQFCFDGTLNNGLLYILAVLSVEVMSVILAGWGSNSKWAIYGAMREACQMVSYEVPLGVSLICGIVVAGTLNLVELGYLQGGGLWAWYIFHNPFLMIAFGLYFIASLASCKRAPFDLPESESELVAGFHTEYSGIRFSFFFFAEYAAMFVIGCIMAFMFLGGWNSPLGAFDPVYRLIDYNPVYAGEQYMRGHVQSADGWEATAQAMGVSAVGLVILNLYSLLLVALKAFWLIFMHMWLRWTLPRIRIDQVMYTCVKVLLPASLITLAGTAVWVLVVPQAIGPAGNLHWGHLLGDAPMVQAITQAALTAIGVLVVLVCVGIVAWAWLHRDTHPRQTFFPDIMPVGRDIAFTAGAPASAAASESGPAAEAAP